MWHQGLNSSVLLRLRNFMVQEFWINTGRGRLFARRWGEDTPGDGARDPIVLFHDSLGCVELWRDFPGRLSLATGRSVIAYDRLGFGKSDPNPDRLTTTFIREEAHSGFSVVHTQLGIEGFVALGHSVGGAMGIVIAGAFPENCRALITESAQTFAEERTLEGIRQAKRTFEQEGQLERLRKYHGGKAQWVLNAWTETWLAPEFSGWSLDRDLPLVHCPLLAIHGDSDEYGSTQHVERIGALAPRATIRILPDCGHVPHRQHEPIVIDAIKELLRPARAALVTDQ
jgi:pimeloyl-ACP methyl ester carboxylesterase